MAKVSRYVQDRLASSLVGTPQQDNSGSIIAQSISQGAGALAGAAAQGNADANAVYFRGVAAQNAANEQAASNLNQATTQATFRSNDIATGLRNTSNQIYRQEQAILGQDIENSGQIIGNELRIRQAQQRQTEQRIEQLNNEIAASHHNLQLGLAVDSLTEQLKESNKATPGNAVKELPEQANILFTDYVENNPMEPLVSAAVQKQFNESLLRQAKELNTYKYTQGKANSEAFVQDDTRQLIQKAGSTVDPVEFGRIIQTLNGKQAEYLAVYGTKGELEMSKAKDAASKNYLNNLYPQNPDAAIKMVESGQFDFLIPDSNDRHGIVDKAHKQITADDRDLTQKKLYQMHLTETSAISIAAEAINDSFRNPKSLMVGRQKIENMLNEELSKPIEQDGKLVRNQKTISFLMTQMGSIDKVINDIDRENKAAERAAKAQSAAARSNALQELRLIKEERRQVEAKEKEHFNSDEGVNIRGKIRGQFDKLILDQGRNGAKIKGTPEEYEALVDVKNDLIDARNKGYIKNEEFSTKLGSVQARFSRLLSQATPSPLEDLWDKVTGRAPDFLQHTINPEGDKRKGDELNSDYTNAMSKSVKDFPTYHNGKQPDENDLKAIQNAVTSKMLGLSPQ